MGAASGLLLRALDGDGVQKRGIPRPPRWEPRSLGEYRGVLESLILDPPPLRRGEAFDRSLLRSRPTSLGGLLLRNSV